MDHNSLTAMGIMNSLRTGNHLADVLIACLAPFVLRVLFDLVQETAQFVRVAVANLRNGQEMPTRYITHVQIRDYSGRVINDTDETAPRNAILVKAVLMYIARPENKISFPHEARTNLISVKEESEVNAFTCERLYGKTVGALKAYRLTRVPIQGVFTVVERDERGNAVEVMIDESNNGTGPDNNGSSGNRSSSSSDSSLLKSATTITLKIRAPEESVVDAFVERAYAWYCGEMDRACRAPGRYLYSMNSSSSTSSSTSSTENNTSSPSNVGLPGFAKYRLSDEGKTFESLFIPRKREIVALLDTFVRKEGIYRIPGVNHKLGFLLVGKPGTGKTSTIKSIAHHLQRHIVTIPLARIKTNGQLMALLYDFPFENSEATVKPLTYSDVVFVIEDVDVASDIVLKRQSSYLLSEEQEEEEEIDDDDETHHEGKEDSASTISSVADEDRRLGSLQIVKLKRIVSTESAAAGGTAKTVKTTTTTVSKGRKKDDDDEDEGEDDEDGSSQKKKKNKKTTTTTTTTTTVRTNNDEEKSLAGVAAAALALSSSISNPKAAPVATQGPGLGPEGGVASKLLKMMGGTFAEDDPLNLAGLLNALDGIVDTPGRVLVMTTNCPDLLDPALIRPGRVDRIVVLGYVCASEAVEMAKHYFRGEVTEELCARLRAQFPQHLADDDDDEAEEEMNIITDNDDDEMHAASRKMRKTTFENVTKKKKKKKRRTPAELEQLAVVAGSAERFVEAVERDEGWMTCRGGATSKLWKTGM